MAGYWMDETTGVLRPVIMAYLDGGELDGQQLATMRAYLRQWIDDPAWHGPDVFALRVGIEDLTSRRAIDRWLDVALLRGIDPL